MANPFAKPIVCWLTGVLQSVAVGAELLLLLTAYAVASPAALIADDRLPIAGEVLPQQLPAIPNKAARLSLDGIFTAKEFEEEKLEQVQWSKRGAGYFTLETPQAGGKGRDLVRNDPASGRKTVVAAAQALVPTGGTDPLDVEGFEFSSDESALLIYTNSQRVWRRNTRGDYWVLHPATGKLRKLGGDAAAATLMFAKFSPDGTRVAFVRENNLYVQELQTLGITALTTDGSATLINGTSDWVNEEELNIRDGYRWSPDGRSIVFWQFDTSGVRQFHLLNNTENNYPRVISFSYPKVGETNSAARLGVVSATGGNVCWLKIPGDAREHYLPQVEWTPDGTQLLVQQFNRLQNENRVMLADPQTGEAQPVFTETDAAWLENENPVRWVGQGQSLLWLSERDGWRHAYLAGFDGQAFAPVTTGDVDVIGIEAVDDAGGWLYYAASPENATQRYLYRTRLSGGTPERLSPAEQPGWHTYNISPDAQWAVHTYSTFMTPPIVEFVHLPDHKVVRGLIDNRKLSEKLASLHLPTSEFLRVEIGEGISLDAWCINPPGMDAAAKYPLMIYVYGEPHGQTVKDMWGGARGLWHQMLAQQGYVVASIDNRGTMSPRGRAWRKCVHRQMGILASQEQAAAVRALLKRWPFVDAERVGVWGWSGGGSMSLNAIFRHPDLYRTAIAVAPNANQLLYDSIYQERYMGLPQDNAAGYRDGSPLTHARNLQGNLLVVHGTGDDNGHFQGTEMLMNELIAHGKQFTVMPYPARSHAITEGQNTVRHFYGLLTQYLHEHLPVNADADSKTSPVPLSPATQRITRDLAGWKLHVHRELLEKDWQLTERAVELLRQQLDEIIRVVPPAAVAELQKVPMYFSPEYPGKKATAEFHPDAGWLRANSRDPAMAKAVEFSNIRIFEAETRRMPNFALHELAHAYHHRVLPAGFANSPIKTAYERAKTSGKYDRTERWHGNGKPNTFERAYAMATPQEYFAETSEAYFSRNDFFPFNRDELQRHDPEMYALLEKLWRIPGNATNAPPP
jgi:dipeptidyl-peptidase 4